MIPLALDEELEAFRRSIRAQAEQTIEPLIADIDRVQRFSPPVWEAVGKLGVFDLAFPKEAGGQGGSFLAFIVATEEIAAVGATAALYPGTTVQVSATLRQHGTPDQIARWLPGLLHPAAPTAWAFTEPQTGSDPKQMTTLAERDGMGWVISGQKTFISFGARASQALVFAKLEDGGLGAFMVDTRSPGWTTGAPIEFLAFGGIEAVPVYIDRVPVPGDSMIGQPGKGFDILLSGEAQGKIRVAAICVGVSQRALEEARRYALERTHRSQPIGRKFPTVQSLLGDMQASVLAARALVRSAAAMVDTGAPVDEAGAAARLIAGRCAREVTGAALQIGGAYGLTRELPLERLYREGKFFEVAQGVAEIQRVVVAKHVLGPG